MVEISLGSMQDRMHGIQPGNGNQNQIENGNLVAARAEGNAPRQNENQISALVYDSDGSAKVHGNCDDNEIFNMFTQEDQYTEILEPIPESHQVPHNDNDVISEDNSVEQGGETVEQHPANFEETRALYDSLYHNLATEVEKVNSVNRKLKETNTDLTTELARYKNQERCFDISQEKYDKLERCYQQSVYQEQCLSKKINALHLSSETQQLAQESHDKIKQMNKEIKPANYTKINHLSRDFVPQNALSREESYFSTNSKTANVSKSFSIQNEDLSDDTTPSVARKFLNEVKSTIMTLQRVVKQRMTIETHNWASSAHQELHKIEVAKFVGDFKSLANEADASLAKHTALELEIKRLLKAVYTELLEPIPESHQIPQNDNDVISEDTSVEQGQSIQTIHMLLSKPKSFYHTEQKMALGYQNPFYLKQAQKKQQSLYDRKVLLEKHDPPVAHDSEETLQLAQESHDKMKQMNKEIKPANYTKINHLSGDIMIIVQNEYVVDTSDLQTELERMKERFENCIIKMETEYAKLWNDWYKKCDECKYDKVLYDKAYKDMQQKIKRLEAQLGDLKGKSKDTSSVSDTQNPLSQKLENENIELEFQVSDQKDNTQDTSANTKFAKQPIVENLPKVGMFSINPSKTSREEKHVPNTVRE
uniref:Uncharacterized protein n=1 Tax=Tanacetum cinerariifolium TaxID=118510 RepID=A0A6L2NWP7_TANCI|nr:hypothetical protein [Tanacetum cinerariifolium]